MRAIWLCYGIGMTLRKSGSEEDAEGHKRGDPGNLHAMGLVRWNSLAVTGERAGECQG